MTKSRKVTTRTPADVRVTWGAEMRPTAYPHEAGRLFMVKGKTAWVIWDGESRPAPIFVGALVSE